MQISISVTFLYVLDVSPYFASSFLYCVQNFISLSIVGLFFQLLSVLTKLHNIIFASVNFHYSFIIFGKQPELQAIPTLAF